MNFLKREANAAIQALTHWLMPPGMRRYDVPLKGGRLYRYPSPGSEPAFHDETYIDYKTAYRDSTHHVRYNVDIHKTTKEFLYISDPLGGNVEEKLKAYGYLTEDQFGNTEAVQRAREQYEKDIGESVDVNVHFDEFGYSQHGMTRQNREAIAEYVTGFFEGLKQHNASEAWLNDLDDIYRAHFYIYKSFDMAADDPVYRQLLIDMNGQLDDLARDRAELGKIEVFKSNPAYWAILDDSYSGENRKKVQAAVKNYIGHEDLTPVHYGEGEIPVKSEQPSIKVPHVSPYVE